MRKAEAGRRLRRSIVQVIREAEMKATPSVFQEVMEEVARLPAVADLAQANEVGQFLAGCSKLQPYLVEELGEDVSFYRGAAHAEGRGLLICFTGFWGRVSPLTPAFLQCLPADAWDVLMLRDGRRTHFRYGCAGFADGFAGLALRIRDLAAPYRHALSVGTSMGGLAAIRLALKIPGIRGVAAGGVAPSDLERMFADPSPVLAFDPLCACLPPVRRDLIFIHSEAHERDRRVARQYAGISGGLVVPVRGQEDHAVLVPLWRRGCLPEFLSVLADSGISGAALAARLEAVAGDPG